MRRLLVAALGALAAAAAPASSATLRPVAGGFDQPTYVAAAPGEPGTLYVVEQPGRIVALAGGKRTTFLDLRGAVSCCGERGLLSVAFHPRYAQNRRFYVDYTDRNGDTRVVEFRAAPGAAAPARVRELLFVRQPYPNHNGGQLQFGPDGRLWVGMGDGGSGGDPGNRAQNVSVWLGKLLRIAVDAPGAPVSVAAYGLRNPWRFSFDAAGNLYVGDVGQDAWEEIDYLPRARLDAQPNFGWSVYEGRARYKNEALNPGGPLVAPVATYPHSLGCSVTGGYVFGGRYWYGDYCSGRVWTLAVRGGRAVGQRLEPFRVDGLTSFGLDGAGRLLAVSQRGTIYRVAQ